MQGQVFADGNKVDTPPLMTYSSVVSRDSVWIVLKLAALNDLDMNCTVIQNTYLNVPFPLDFHLGTCFDDVFINGIKGFCLDGTNAGRP